MTMSDREWLAERFEEHRRHLRAVAYRMLGSLNEADDAVQEAWIRLNRSDAAAIENLGGWLTTVVGRVCLNILEARGSRREEPAGVHVPDPVVSPESGVDPEQEALLADLVGLALLVVLETLTPAERLAFVLHDMFAVPFDEIAPIVGGAAPPPDADPAIQRALVEGFVAAARAGDFDALLRVLDPDVVVRADAGAPPAGMSRVVRGAEAVARAAMSFSQLDLYVHPALINGTAGTVSLRDGRPFSVAGFTVRRGTIVEIDILADPERLRRLDLTILDR